MREQIIPVKMAVANNVRVKIIDRARAIPDKKINNTAAMPGCQTRKNVGGDPAANKPGAFIHPNTIRKIPNDRPNASLLSVITLLEIENSIGRFQLDQKINPKTHPATHQFDVPINIFKNAGSISNPNFKMFDDKLVAILKSYNEPSGNRIE
ncbi:MAG: hypothetical protein VYA17_03825 [Pseudomonadota bacterium]|nr:hypothetical protein [Pseudomonadota bacterium]